MEYYEKLLSDSAKEEGKSIDLRNSEGVYVKHIEAHDVHDYERTMRDDIPYWWWRRYISHIKYDAKVAVETWNEQLDDKDKYAVPAKHHKEATVIVKLEDKYE
jgi:hypothetical protein